MTKRKKWGVTLLLLPGVSLVLVLLMQVVVRFALTKTADSSINTCETSLTISTDTDCQDNIPTKPSTLKRTINVFSILIGSLSVLGFLPLVVAGVVLLATPGKQDVPPTT